MLIENPIQQNYLNKSEFQNYSQLNVRHLDNDELLKHLSHTIYEERTKTNEVLECLREVDRRMIYAELGFSSLFDFCVKYLGYSEGSAQRRISAMRMIREIPELKEKLAAGNITLANLSKLSSFIRHRQKSSQHKLDIKCKRELLPLIENKTQKEVERTFSTMCPSIIESFQSTKAISAEHVEIKMVLNAKQSTLFENVRLAISNLLPNATHAEALECVCEYYLAKKRI